MKYAVLGSMSLGHGFMMNGSLIIVIACVPAIIVGMQNFG